MFDGAKWWARREVKAGKTAPPNYVEDNTDPVTGKTQGWEPIEQSAFAKFHAEVLNRQTEWVSSGEEPHQPFPIGTYELVGPKVNGNPEREDQHVLINHDYAEIAHDAINASTIDRIKEIVALYSELNGWEGIVWHHPDGRMAKLKARDLDTPTESA